MAFIDNRVVEQAWRRSSGKCECTKSTHGHRGRCNKPLVWTNKGKGNTGRWDACGSCNSDCKILCAECHRMKS